MPIKGLFDHKSVFGQIENKQERKRGNGTARIYETGEAKI